MQIRMEKGYEVISINQTRNQRKDSMSKPKVELRKVTPEWAAEILRKHDESIVTGKYRQRSLSEKDVAKYATDMKAGNWGVTGQGISFDEEQNLLDGQHRLAAVVKSGVTVEMVVIWDLASHVTKQIKTVDVFDIGKKRQVAQQLRMDGFEYYAEIGTAARCLLMLACGNIARPVSPPQVIAIANLMRNNITKIIQTLRKESAPKTKTRGFIVAPLVLFGTVDPDTAELFASEFNEMANLSKTSPVLQYARFLDRPSTVKGGDHQRLVAMSALASALFSYSNERRVEMIRGNQEHVEWLLKTCKNAIKQMREVAGLVLTMDELKEK